MTTPTPETAPNIRDIDVQGEPELANSAVHFIVDYLFGQGSGVDLVGLEQDIRDYYVNASVDARHMTGLFLGSGLVGLCAWSEFSDRRAAAVDYIVVAPTQRGRGWGRLLLRDVELRVAGRVDKITIPHARQEAWGFFQRLGYTRPHPEEKSEFSRRLS